VIASNETKLSRSQCGYLFPKVMANLDKVYIVKEIVISVIKMKATKRLKIAIYV